MARAGRDRPEAPRGAPFEIRLARRADVDEVDRMLGDFAAADGWARATIAPEERAAFGRRAAGGMRVWIAVDPTGRAFGFAAAHEAHDLPEGRGAWLSDLWVEPEWRRRGVGRDLVAAVKAWTLARGGRWLMWHTAPANAGAREFYASIGATERPSHLLVTLKFGAPRAKRQRRI